MRRRSFVGRLGGLGIGAWAVGPFRGRRPWPWMEPGSDEPVPAVRRPGPELGVWIGDAGEPARYPSFLDRLGSAGVTFILPNVGNGLDALAELTRLASERGIAVHAWQPTLMNGSQAAAHPEWYAVSRAGVSTAVEPPYVDYYRFLCPTRAPVRAWLRERIRAVAAIPGLASVHLDYIRFPDVILPVGLWSRYDLVQDREYPDFDFCYCDVCRAAFRARGGTDPLELRDPTISGSWRRFRWDAITRVVSELHDTVHAEGTTLTAAVFPTPAIARRLVRQDWTSWPLDGVMPMIYHSFYEKPVDWIGEATAAGVAGLSGRVPHYAGLFVPASSPAELARGARLALTAGSSGIVLFDHRAMTDAHWTTVGEAMGREAGGS